MARLVFEEVPSSCYIAGAAAYSKALSVIYEDLEQTTPEQIDVLVWYYRVTSSDLAFSLLFCTHQFLLGKLVNKVFFKYQNHLIREDYHELLSMAYGEFHRRVMHYKIPPEAPFSAYIKLYMKQWLNVYAKIMAKHNMRNLFEDDSKHMAKEINKSEHQIFKVQVALNSNNCLVYNKDRSLQVEFPLDKNIKKQMQGKPKDFFYGVVDKETKTVHITATKAPWQEW